MNTGTNRSSTSACGVATQLLGAYREALAAYDKVRCAAFQNVISEHITLREAAQAREDAHRVVMCARRAYWKHVDEHACGRLMLERTTSRVVGRIRILSH